MRTFAATWLLTGPVLCMQVLHPERVHEHQGMCAVRGSIRQMGDMCFLHAGLLSRHAGAAN